MAKTTVHVHRAKAGDASSLEWLVSRFSPLLLAQARYRLGDRAGRVHPEDLVNDVWAVALRALPTLRAQSGRETPVFLKFLSTTLLYRSNELLRRQIRERRGGAPATEGLSQLPAQTRGAFSRAELRDDYRHVREAIERLPEEDRQIVVLRGIEQLPNQEVAALLGQTPNAISLRYNRALKALRERLAGSVFDELDED